MELMAAVDSPLPGSATLAESQAQLSRELRRLTRIATFIAIMTSPSIYYWFHHHEGNSVTRSVLLTFAICVIFRGVTDILVRRAIPWPSLFGTDDKRLREEDIVNRRRAWTWGFWLRMARLFIITITVIWAFKWVQAPAGDKPSWFSLVAAIPDKLGSALTNSQLWIQIVFVTFLFLANFLIFMGPLLLMGISQIRGYEPGDAEWGVKLEDV